MVRADVQFGFDTERAASRRQWCAPSRTSPGWSGCCRHPGMGPAAGQGPGSPSAARARPTWPSPGPRDRATHQSCCARGAPQDRQGEVAIDVFTADKYGFALGDPDQHPAARTAGSSSPWWARSGYGTPTTCSGATVVLFDLETAQVVLNFGGEYSQLAVVVAPGADPEAVRAGHRRRSLPEGTEAITARRADRPGGARGWSRRSASSTPAAGLRRHRHLRGRLPHPEHLPHRGGAAHPGTGDAARRGRHRPPGHLDGASSRLWWWRWWRRRSASGVGVLLAVGLRALLGHSGHRLPAGRPDRRSPDGDRGDGGGHGGDRGLGHPPRPQGLEDPAGRRPARAGVDLLQVAAAAGAGRRGHRGAWAWPWC